MLGLLSKKYEFLIMSYAGSTGLAISTYVTGQGFHSPHYYPLITIYVCLGRAGIPDLNHYYKQNPVPYPTRAGPINENPYKKQSSF